MSDEQLFGVGHDDLGFHSQRHNNFTQDHEVTLGAPAASRHMYLSTPPTTASTSTSISMYYDMNSTQLGYETSVRQGNSSTMVAYGQHHQQQVPVRHPTPPKKSINRYTNNVTENESNSTIQSLDEFAKTATATAGLFGATPLIGTIAGQVKSPHDDRNNAISSAVTDALSSYVTFNNNTSSGCDGKRKQHSPVTPPSHSTDVRGRSGDDGNEVVLENPVEEDDAVAVVTSDGDRASLVLQKKSVVDDSAPVQHKTTTNPLASRVNKRRKTVTVANRVMFDDEVPSKLARRADDCDISDIITRLESVENVINAFNLRVAGIENLVLQTKVEFQNYMLTQANNTISNLSGGLPIHQSTPVVISPINAAAVASSSAASTVENVNVECPTVAPHATTTTNVPLSVNTVQLVGKCNSEAIKCDLTPGPQKLMLFRLNSDPTKYRLFRKTPQLQEDLASYTKVCSIPTNEDNPDKTKKMIKDAILKRNRDICTPILEKQYEEATAKMLAEDPKKKPNINKGQQTRQCFNIHGAFTMVGTSLKLITATEEELKALAIECGIKSRETTNSPSAKSRALGVGGRRKSVAASSRLVYLEESDEEMRTEDKQS
ncbi:hypothetical protein F8203_gp113 [Heliothis virescens ascovirus 3f]|uniref:Uncharacterized protein n=1 Tax=Heliothis virescens ascovirus 3f TaxID=328614 RepID=A0A171PVK5_9VIRU|nr:hypothetical protein F8203_gp113 [Heliothis virescens ascovirus 3f]AJP09079.1 hypothetical protein [Heliothis virescens ascovirus 3f]